MRVDASNKDPLSLDRSAVNDRYLSQALMSAGSKCRILNWGMKEIHVASARRKDGSAIRQNEGSSKQPDRARGISSSLSNCLQTEESNDQEALRQGCPRHRRIARHRRG